MSHSVRNISSASIYQAVIYTMIKDTVLLSKSSQTGGENVPKNPKNKKSKHRRLTYNVMSALMVTSIGRYGSTKAE